jgi:2OG-Fe(II) oxygenase superfamily
MTTATARTIRKPMAQHLTYLDAERLGAVDAEAFRSQKPYPWANPGGLLTEEGFRRLYESLPDVGQMQPVFGVQRKHGQKSHDRWALEYRPDLPVAAAWHEFVRELEGPIYRRFLHRLTGERFIRLNYHWHYTPNGCSVSPHCDAVHKIGSHIFYFNTAEDWDRSWGGETLILDDNGRFARKSAPAFEDFDRIIAGEALGNRSLLFRRRENSWHGVREIRCPQGAYRKVFIVVLNHWSTPVRRWWNGEKKKGDY